MAMPEQFSLRWNDFHSNLSQSFQALLEGEDLVDVTLAAGGQYVHAHKLILSVCSPYFKELFKMNPCDHPIVILKDVAHHELRQLLQFMYRGEVHVRQQELSGFLHTAELLQVKGLTGGREKSESPPPVAEEESSNTQPSVPEPVSDSLPEWVPPGEEITAETVVETVGPVVPKEEAARSPLKRLLKNTTNKNSFNINKKKPRPVNDIPAHAENTEYASDGEPMIDFDNDIFHNLVLPDSGKEAGWNCKTGGVKCPSCHRFFANRYNLKVHIRDKHDTREGTLQCDICQKRMRNPSCLRVHMYHHRKQAAYLAQLSAQGDQMRHVVQNMVENKWRTEAKAEFRETEKNKSRSALIIERETVIEDTRKILPLKISVPKIFVPKISVPKIFVPKISVPEIIVPKPRPVKTNNRFTASAPAGEANNFQPAQQDVKFAPEAILPKTEASHETV